MSTRWAHRDDASERGNPFSRSSQKPHRIGRPSCLENPRPKRGIYQLTESDLSPFQAEPAQGQSTSASAGPSADLNILVALMRMTEVTARSTGGKEGSLGAMCEGGRVGRDENGSEL
jgi:hypothetical protein